MKTLVLLLMASLFQAGCRNEHNKSVMSSVTNNYGMTSQTGTYPILIDSGTKIVYQFGHMTPDKGLKLYLDTVPTPSIGVSLDESVRRALSTK